MIPHDWVENYGPKNNAAISVVDAHLSQYFEKKKNVGFNEFAVSYSVTIRNGYKYSRKISFLLNNKLPFRKNK